MTTDTQDDSWDPGSLPPGGGRIRRHTHGGVVELVLDQPEVRNALSAGMMAALRRELDELLLRPPRGLLLRGEGSRAFCSGGDLRDVRAHLIDKEAGAGMCRTMGRLLDRLLEAPFPVVAAVEGVALGGGAELLTACHLVLAGAGARVGFVHAALGVSPGWGGGRRLLARLGPARARRVLLEARPLSDQEALRLGLVDEVVPTGTARERALALLQRSASHPPEAVAAALRIAGGAGRAEEERSFAELWGSPEHRARLEAALGAPPRGSSR